MTNCKIWAFALYLQSLSREERLWCHICDMYYNFLCILIWRTLHLVAMYRRQGLLKTYLNLDPQRTKIWPWFVFHKCLQKHRNISKHVIITCMHYTQHDVPTRNSYFHRAMTKIFFLSVIYLLSVCEYIILWNASKISCFWVAKTTCDVTWLLFMSHRNNILGVNKFEGEGYYDIIIYFQHWYVAYH